MPRDENGFLKADALRQGLREQFMIERGGIRHTVEIMWDPYFYEGFATRYTTDDAGHIQREVHRFKDDLAGAQRVFTRIVRGLGGRA
jgi:hypothetical protein